jgi:type IV pilus assembly protein PilF
MNNASAARSRFVSGWMAAAALGAALAGGLAGCATPHEQQATSDMSSTEEPEFRRRARIRLELASSYYAEGKTEVALDELKQVIAIDPMLPDAYNLRGLIYMRLGDNRQAEDSFRRSIALNPRDSDSFHNYGWLQCQMARYAEAVSSFQRALSNPMYGGRSKTYMAQGLCQARGGQLGEAEQSLTRSYELDPGNPITGYNLSRLLFQRGEFERAQFYIRRLNNSELANNESLWLGIKVEQRMKDAAAMGQLSEQLRKRYPQSPERGALDRRAFDE